MEMIPKAFHSPSPFCFSSCSISKVSPVRALIKFSFTCALLIALWQYSYSCLWINIGFQHAWGERAERLRGQSITWINWLSAQRSWEHFAIWDVQALFAEWDHLWSSPSSSTPRNSSWSNLVLIFMKETAQLCPFPVLLPHWFLFIRSVGLCPPISLQHYSWPPALPLALPLEHAQLIL